MRGTAWANAFQTIVFMVLGVITFFVIASKLGGHDSMLENLKDHEHPVLLHVLTEKGQGAHGAEKDPYKFHSPPSVTTPKSSSKPKALGWSEAFTSM